MAAPVPYPDETYNLTVQQQYQQLAQLVAQGLMSPDELTNRVREIAINKNTSVVINTNRPFEDLLMNFDPFKVFPEYRIKVEQFARKKVEEGITNSTSPGGLPSYLLRDEDFDNIIDPLSRALHKDQIAFITSIQKYLHPYSVAISLAEDTFNTSIGLNRRHFIFKLGKTDQSGKLTTTVYMQKVTYEHLQKIKSIEEIYYILDEMVAEYEKSSAVFIKRDIHNELENAAAKALVRADGTLAVHKEADIFFEEHMYYDYKTRRLGLLTDEEKVDRRKQRNRVTPQLVSQFKPKEKKPILCPDHGSAMMRRKGDDDHLRCTIPGCTRILKRKKPGVPTEEPKDAVEAVDPVKESIDKTTKVMKEFSDALAKMSANNLPPVGIVGFDDNEPYVSNQQRVYMHQEGGRTYLCQNFGGLWQRIDVTTFMRDIRHISQPVYVTSFNSQNPQSVPGPSYVEMTMSGLQPM